MACAETHAAHAAGIVGAAESGVPVRADGVHTGVPDDDADVRVSRRQDCAQLLLNCGLLRDFDLLLMVQWPVQLLLRSCIRRSRFSNRFIMVPTGAGLSLCKLVLGLLAQSLIR